MNFKQRDPVMYNENINEILAFVCADVATGLINYKFASKLMYEALHVFD